MAVASGICFVTLTTTVLSACLALVKIGLERIDLSHHLGLDFADGDVGIFFRHLDVFVSGFLWVVLFCTCIRESTLIVSSQTNFMFCQ